MAEERADFTLVFRRLADSADPSGTDDSSVRSLFDDPTRFDAWAMQWRRRLQFDSRDFSARRHAMRQVNPAYIPRNHRVQQVIDAAETGDLEPLNEFLSVLSTPFDDHPELADFARPPAPEEVVKRTFCGT